MDPLLKQAQALYHDRQKIALATILVAFTATLYILYNAPIIWIGPAPDIPVPTGWVAGFETVASFNTVGLFLAVSIMIFFYAFWTWAYLPNPATVYTQAVIQGILGEDINIRQMIGRRFRISLENGTEISIRCRTRNGSGEWFVYNLESSPIEDKRLEEIALRHGMHTNNGRFSTWVSSDELHSRLLLLTKAIRITKH
ncbi:MAG: hypothetical protein K9W43_12935 [Candidatus Thorarchaeota archaeon]|nr:hypothetical protein [Candidatus Thorarchaeota archaeon]